MDNPNLRCTTGLVVKLLPKITTAIPSSLVAVVLATAASSALQLPVATLAQVGRDGERERGRKGGRGG